MTKHNIPKKIKGKIGEYSYTMYAPENSDGQIMWPALHYNKQRVSLELVKRLTWVNSFDMDFVPNAEQLKDWKIKKIKVTYKIGKAVK